MTPHDRDRRRRTIAALLEARDALRAEREALYGRRRDMMDDYVAVTVALGHVDLILEWLTAREEVTTA